MSEDTENTEPGLHRGMRIVRDVVDGDATLNMHEISYLKTPGQPDMIIEMHEGPVTLSAGSLIEMSKLIGLAREAMTHEVMTGLVGWHLEHSDVILENVHDEALCIGRPCTIHNRTNHHMRDMRQIWRSDAGFMERLCEHGVAHPDPDELPANRNRVHGCCMAGCCHAPA